MKVIPVKDPTRCKKIFDLKWQSYLDFNLWSGIDSAYHQIKSGHFEEGPFCSHMKLCIGKLFPKRNKIKAYRMYQTRLEC